MKNYNSILITGTSSGFGLMAAVALAKKGYRVYATMRNLQSKEKLLAQCQQAEVALEIRQLDVTQPETISSVVGEMHKKCNGPDVLINNAGFGCVGFFEDTSNHNFAQLLATNFYGSLNCTREVLPGMRERGKGLILNISSENGVIGFPTMSAYCASKFAVEGWSEALRYEVKKFGIYVVLLEPGAFKTEIFSERNLRRGDYVNNKESPYYQAYRRIEENTLQNIDQLAADPAVVVNKIVDIVSTKHPKLRYLVGFDAHTESLLKRFLPANIFEWILQKILNVYSD